MFSDQILTVIFLKLKTGRNVFEFLVIRIKKMGHAKIYVPKLKRPAVERKKSYVLTFGTYVRQNAPTLQFDLKYINFSGNRVK